MPGLTIATVPLLLAFIVPGFVWSRVYRVLHVDPGRSEERWLACFALSAFNFAVCTPLIPVLLRETTRLLDQGGSGSPLLVGLGWFLVTFVVPTFLGVATGLAQRLGLLRNIFRSIGVTVHHPVNSAWAYAFGGTGPQSPLWCSVVLNDGSIIEGLYSNRSHAASDEPRDLYLEAQAQRDEDKLIGVPTTRGVWVAREHIVCIEFKAIVQHPPLNEDTSHGTR